MNILPKKRWHVRTKDNIARVRRDEAEAAEKERQEQKRIENADREARLAVLKSKSRQKLLEHNVEEPNQSKEGVPRHVNLFENLEQAVSTTNKDHDDELKTKKEDYEKKIGYLTYLGQDTNETLKKKNWYEVLPESSRFSRSSDIKDTYDKLVLKDADGKPKEKGPEDREGEVDYKSKKRHDPINAFEKYCFKNKLSKREKTPEKVKKTESLSRKNKELGKKRRDKNEEKQNKLQKLREARIKREQREKIRTESFLAGLHGEPEPKEKSPIPKIKPKYNSQFNPDLARQNYY